MIYYREGDAPERAAARAYRNVLGREYTMMETYRVPNEYVADQISSEAELLLQSMTGDGFAIPRSLSGLSPEHAKSAYMSVLLEQGYWVTASDESGLMLYDGDRRPVMTTKWEPAVFTWAEILTMRDERHRVVPDGLQGFSDEVNRAGLQ